MHQRMMSVSTQQVVIYIIICNVSACQKCIFASLNCIAVENWSKYSSTWGKCIIPDLRYTGPAMIKALYVKNKTFSHLNSLPQSIAGNFFHPSRTLVSIIMAHVSSDKYRDVDSEYCSVWVTYQLIDDRQAWCWIHCFFSVKKSASSQSKIFRIDFCFITIIIDMLLTL